MLVVHSTCVWAPLTLSVLSSAIARLPPCRGYKTVLRFFPNDVACLEPVVALLVHLDALASPALAAAPADGGSSGSSGAAAAVPRLDSGAQSLWEAQESLGMLALLAVRVAVCFKCVCLQRSQCWLLVTASQVQGAIPSPLS